MATEDDCELFCIQCGNLIHEDDSPGVYLHDDAGGMSGAEWDSAHTAIPEQDTDSGY